jgi:hypothetical protein
MTVPTLVLAFTAVVCVFAVVCATTQPEPEPEPEPAGRHRRELIHRPLMGQPAAKLPQRKPGLAALKAEIMLTPPNLHIRKHRPDWAWNTEEHRQVWESWFAGQPEDRAVMLVEVR